MADERGANVSRQEAKLEVAGPIADQPIRPKTLPPHVFGAHKLGAPRPSRHAPIPEWVPFVAHDRAPGRRFSKKITYAHSS